MVIANLYLSFSAHLNPIRKAFPFPLFLDKLISLRLLYSFKISGVLSVEPSLTIIIFFVYTKT